MKLINFCCDLTAVRTSVLIIQDHYNHLPTINLQSYFGLGLSDVCRINTTFRMLNSLPISVDSLPECYCRDQATSDKDWN